MGFSDKIDPRSEPLPATFMGEDGPTSVSAGMLTTDCVDRGGVLGDRACAAYQLAWSEGTGGTSAVDKKRSFLSSDRRGSLGETGTTEEVEDWNWNGPEPV